MEIPFWIALSLMIYTYILYPLVLVVLNVARNVRRWSPVEGFEPTVSLIIAAYNEANFIKSKIENSLALDYPSQKLEIIIVSDGSTDSTNDIIAACQPDSQIHFHNYPVRRGKAHAINLAMVGATGDICIFSDANVLYDERSVRMIVRNFADRSVGCVTGHVKLRSTGSQSTGEGLYMRYERFIQECESNFATAVGTDGAMYAIRRELFTPLVPETILDDLMTALRSVKSGWRIVYEKGALGLESSAADIEQEFKRKVRIAAGGFQLLSRERWLLNPLRQPSVFLLFVSHKLLRWLLPWIWSVAWLSNACLLNGNAIYKEFFAFQVLFILLALGAWRFKHLRRYTFFNMPLYLTTLNLAAAVGLFRHLFGRQQVTWEKSRK